MGNCLDSGGKDPAFSLELIWISSFSLFFEQNKLIHKKKKKKTADFDKGHTLSPSMRHTVSRVLF